jgi:hypothetical protein
MNKSLSQRISLKMQNSRSSRNARNLAAFLALREDISHALDDGWPVYHIWETLHEEQKITASYTTFCGQVRRLLGKSGKPGSAPVPAAVLPSLQGPAASRPAGARTPRKSDGFIFSSTPNDEELL